MNDQEFNQLLRAFVDDELDGAQAEPVREQVAADEQAQARVKFERALRERVGVVMQEATPAAPAGLADRVRAALAETSLDERPEVVIAGRIDGRSANGRWRWGRSLLAAAAMIAVVTAAILYGSFGNKAVDPPMSLLFQTSQFVSEVHVKCMDEFPKMSAEAFPWQSADEAQRKLTEHINPTGLGVQVFDLSALGYVFDGAGTCRVPGKCSEGNDLPSGHMMFTHQSDRGQDQQQHMVTMYMVPNLRQYCGCLREDLPPLEWFDMPCGGGGPATLCGILDARSACFYFLVCSDGTGLDAVKQAIQAALRDADPASGNAP